MALQHVCDAFSSIVKTSNDMQLREVHTRAILVMLPRGDFDVFGIVQYITSPLPYAQVGHYQGRWLGTGVPRC